MTLYKYFTLNWCIIVRYNCLNHCQNNSLTKFIIRNNGSEMLMQNIWDMTGTHNSLFISLCPCPLDQCLCPCPHDQCLCPCPLDQCLRPCPHDQCLCPCPLNQCLCPCPLDQCLCPCPLDQCLCPCPLDQCFNS